MARFSERHGISRSVEIKYREDLPEQIRLPIYEILRETSGASYLLGRARYLFDRFGVTPLPLYTGTIAAAKDEDDVDTITFKRFILGCEWFQIYDLIEDVFAQLDFFEEENRSPDEQLRAYPLQREINDYFVQAGIGWKMEAGHILSRGDAGFETAVIAATTALKDSARPTTASHLHDALTALSRRPNADFAGAMYHATGCLEALARDLTGEPKSTFGEILKEHPGLLPPPLDKALSQIWGFSSQQARHVSEGGDPKREETALVIGLVATIVPYLLQKVAKPAA
jgi:hypothetical protein